MDRSSTKVELLHDTFQIGINFVVFAANHGKKKSWQIWFTTLQS